MTHQLRTRVVRPLLPVATACTLVLGGAALVPAAADTPQNWEKAPDVSALGFLLVLVIIPLGAAAVIALLAVLPSLASDKGYRPGHSWRGESEWFGGPTKGVHAADELAPEQIEAGTQGSGGTSGRW
jgi:hypothetical protein